MSKTFGKLLGKLTLCGLHHRNPSLANIFASLVIPVTSRHSKVNTAATMNGKLRILSHSECELAIKVFLSYDGWCE